MSDYPINLHIAERHCAVLGGGAVAERKVLSLLEAGACVTVMSPQLTPRLAELAGKRRITHSDGPYEAGCLADFFIVICATGDRLVNRRAAQEARAHGSLVNVVDDADQGNFTVPAHIVRGDLMITVSTGGKSPVFARRLREEIGAQYGEEYGMYLELISKVREEMKEKLPTAREREVFWREAVCQDVLGLLRQGKLKEAEAKIKNAISSNGTES